MPRTKRQEILRRHDQVLDMLEKCVGYVAELHDQFAPVHPEYAKGYENILYILAQAHEFTETMKNFV